MKRSTAIRLLGDRARNTRTNQLLESRISALMSFHQSHPEVKVSSISIEENNTWSNCPAPKSAKIARHLGGTTYQYQVWAVVRNGRVVEREQPYGYTLDRP